MNSSKVCYQGSRNDKETNCNSAEEKQQKVYTTTTTSIGGDNSDESLDIQDQGDDVRRQLCSISDDNNNACTTTTSSSSIQPTALPEAKQKKKKRQIQNRNNDSKNKNKTKRIRLLLSKASSNVNSITAIETILDLPDDPIAYILEFVGLGEFVYIAGVCKKFAKIYKTVHGGNGNRKTLYRNVVESISRVQSWLKDKKGGSTKGNLRTIAKKAASWGNVKILDYIMSQHPSDSRLDASSSSSLTLWDDDRIVSHIRRSAAISRSGHQFDILKLSMTKSKFLWERNIIYAAVKDRRLDVIEWMLKETDCPREANVYRAAFIGDLQVLRCLIENGCPYNGQMMLKAAAAKGQLEIIKFARQQLNVPGHSSDCYLSTRYGHLNALQWMVANGFPWDRTRCRMTAEERGFTEIVNWIDENHNSNN